MFKVCLSIFATAWPVNFIRIFFLRVFFNIKFTGKSRIGLFNIFRVKNCSISNSSIGSFNYINSKSFSMDTARMGHLNKFKFLNESLLENGSWIKNRNSFIGTLVETDLEKQGFFQLGSRSLITYSHYFDVTGGIKIGENVVFGGLCSQVWTHGFDHLRNFKASSIILGNNIYVGARSLIIQGVSICDNVTIGAGTTITKNIDESGFYTSSTQIIKKAYL